MLLYKKSGLSGPFTPSSPIQVTSEQQSPKAPKAKKKKKTLDHWPDIVITLKVK